MNSLFSKQHHQEDTWKSYLPRLQMEGEQVRDNVETLGNDQPAFLSSWYVEVRTVTCGHVL